MLFFIVHITQVIKAGWNNFRAMVTGFEVVSVSEPYPACSSPRRTAAGPPASPHPTASSAAGAADVNAPDSTTDGQTDLQAERQIERLTRQQFRHRRDRRISGAGRRGLARNAPGADGIPWPLRRCWNGIETGTRVLSADAVGADPFDQHRPHAPRQMVNRPGQWLRSGGVVPARGKLRGGKPLHLTLDQIKALPQIDTVTELKCIEGWSDPVRWTGAGSSTWLQNSAWRPEMANTADLQRPSSDLFQYVNLSTPDGAYYVGLDIESAFHPQTLLCYEMNGKPLTAHMVPRSARDSCQVRHQVHQVHRHDPFYGRASRRLLGRAGLRLVRRTLSTAIVTGELRTHEFSKSTDPDRARLRCNAGLFEKTKLLSTS